MCVAGPCRAICSRGGLFAKLAALPLPLGSQCHLVAGNLLILCFLPLWAGGATVATTAKRAGISERTGCRRMKNPDFQKRVVALRAEMLQRAIGKLVDASTEAADTLRRLLMAQNENVQLQAARNILEIG